MSYNTDLQANNVDLQGILAAVNALPENETVPEVEQATPVIKFDALSGLITASATQEAGKVSAGTKSAEPYQVTTKGTETFIPTTKDQYIYGTRYLTGTQVIKGDVNLIPENIVKGKTIFGVAGSAEVGGGSAAPETCQVQIDVMQSDATTSFVEVNGVPDATVMVGNISDTFTVLKNTIISVEAPYYYRYDCGDGVSFVSESNNYTSFYFFVTGDGWLTLG